MASSTIRLGIDDAAGAIIYCHGLLTFNENTGISENFQGRQMNFVNLIIGHYIQAES
jgi:hypothetical protein